MSDTKPSFSESSAQLDEILARLQDESIDVDAALKLHQQGSKLVDQLEKQLDVAEAKVKRLRPKQK